VTCQSATEHVHRQSCFPLFRVGICKEKVLGNEGLLGEATEIRCGCSDGQLFYL